MENKKTPAIRIVDWFVKWWDRNNKHTVCLIAEIDNELHLIEKELENE